MIHISFSTACFIYLLLTLVAVFSIWFYAYLRKKDQKQAEPYKLFICEYCQHVYLDDIDLMVSSCPQCLLLNKKSNESNKEKP